ncbi:MAG TPA: heme-binding protein [Aliidongia sp.]|nr:heme-binding protein [Aliidongia sp.]
MKIHRWLISTFAAASALCGAHPALADNDFGGSSGCGGLPNWSTLRAALKQAVSDETSGLDFQMWATLVSRDGTVCAVAFSGDDFTDQWLGSRVISAQKANTAVDFSLNNKSTSTVFPSGLALSTANLYSATQPGGSLYGLQASNPVSADAAYAGSSSRFGGPNDPMVGNRIGGVNVFGGGFALYRGGKNVGGVGVSGDTSCADHDIGWRVRHNLGFDQLKGVGGVSGDPQRPDNIVYDIKPNPNGGTGISAGGFGHPTCIRTGDQTALPPVH